MRLLRAPLSVRGLVLTVVVGGVLVMLVGALQLPSQAPSSHVVVLALGLLFVGGLPVVNLRFGHTQESYDWSELALVLAIVLLSWPWLLILVGLAGLASHALSRRPLQKAAFNAMQGVISAAGAVAVYTAVAPSSAQALGRHAAALVAASLTYALLSGVLVAAVVALSQRLPITVVYRHGLGLRALVWLLNTALGLVVLGLGLWSRDVLVVLPPLLLVLFATYRGYVRAMGERDVWRQLDAASRELHRLEESEVVSAAVTRAVSLFRADVVELELYSERPWEPGRGFRCRPGGEPAGVDSYLAPARPDSPPPAGSPTATAAPGIPAQGAPKNAGAPLTAPLPSPQGELGLIRVCFDAPVRVQQRDRQVLATFAHTVASTLLNARLHERVRRQAERKAYEAAHDPLTGLANRSLLTERAAQALLAAQTSDEVVGLLLLDLDEFKEVNDTLGHSAGDELLRTIAARLAARVRVGDTVARLGGDEFVVLLTRLTDTGPVEAIAADLLSTLSGPVEVNGLQLSVEASAGAACAPEDGDNVEDLLKRADIALYQAKRARGSFLRWSQDWDETGSVRLGMAAELRRALQSGELVLHFQPQVTLSGGEVIGFEALVRWQHPKRGLVLPLDFVPIAEHSGLIRNFSLYVLDLAVAECAGWQRSGAGPGTTVSVNLSARALMDTALPSAVATVLTRHGLPGRLLVLEITETVVLRELEMVEEVLGALRRLGVQIAVDDFGTGYSSLTFLQRVAVNEVKVDKSFVRGMLVVDGDAAIVRATIDLAHGLGLRVVAEGVESDEHMTALAAMGCDVAQGFQLASPMPAAEVIGWLGRHPAATDEVPSGVVVPMWGRGR